MESPILKAMTASYKALYGKEPAVTAIHAGLECGIIGSKYPKMDMISFGPTICYPHSPDEKVEIASVGKFYDFMVDTLRNIPEKVSAAVEADQGQMVRHRQSRGRRRPRA